MKVVILAAGYATRLYPLTENKPKCLLEVGGVTILDRTIQQINEVAPLEEVVLVTNARFFDVLSAWKNKSACRVPVRIVNDGTTSNDNRLGAVGDLQFTIRQLNIKTDILLMASDNLFEQSLASFADFARSKKDAVVIGIYDIGDPRAATKKFGVIETSSTGEVVGFEEKPEKPRSSFIGMGVYYFPAKTLPFVEEYMAQKDAKDAPGFYVSWLLGKVKIFSLVFKGLWYDIGDFNSLEEANRIFKSKKK